ncbi:small ribosomal subunit protein mS40 [Pholidichthys leucotaenia]
MAVSMQFIAKALTRLSPFTFYSVRWYQRAFARTCPALATFGQPSHFYCRAASLQDEAATRAEEPQAHYKEKPWEYLKSEEYTKRYGTNPVWLGYRRNHKGSIPPQKTRKQCIRGGKVCGNPCPICRDPNIIIHYQNVKLLEQFISPHSGIVYEATRTGVCRKQQQKLNEAISTARNHGLLPFHIPHVDFSEDYSNSHDAVGSTPPPPSLTAGDNWYYWYGAITPDQNEVAKVKKLYKAYLK